MFWHLINYCKTHPFYHYFYTYFFRYFLDQEVGHFVAILNGMLSTFTIGFLTLYAMKGWGLRSWNRNLVKNKTRFVAIALRRLKEELSKNENEEKINSRKYIVSLKFDELKEKLQKELITAEQTVDAYLSKAIEIDERYNCVTEFVKDSLDNARTLDVRYKGQTKPPLFGIPFSVKDNFHMKGYDSTIGLAKHVEDPKTDTSSLVVHLKSLGAIPIVRTNVPQTMLSFCCSNPVFGNTTNPYNTNCTVGGSSGGEACIIAAGGCPFGIGSDIGGSLRIPAHFCGVVSLKPCETRLTVSNVDRGVDGCVRLGLSYGFFTRDVKTQNLLWSLTLTEEYFSRNPYTIPMPFQNELTQPNSTKSKGKIGYYVDDGWFEAVPSCQRAVEMAVEALKDSGYELVKFCVPDTWIAFRLAVKALFSDNQQGWLESMDYEDIDDSVKTNYKLAKTPLFLRKCLSKIIGLKWPMEAHALGSYVEDLNDLRVAFADIKKYRGDFVQSLVDQGIDAIVCPAFTFPAIPPSWCTDLSAAFFYTCIYNLLDLPAGVVPVTHVSLQDIENLAYYPRCILNGQRVDSLPFSRAPFYSYVRRAVQEAGAGLPVNVQVVSLPYREEHCLKIMAQIESCVNFKQFEQNG